MVQQIKNFLADESGQDLIEYSLLICFIAIASIWLLGGGRAAVSQIWSTTDTRLDAARAAANN